MIMPNDEEIRLMKFNNSIVLLTITIHQDFSVKVHVKGEKIDIRSFTGFQVKIECYTQLEAIIH